MAQKLFDKASLVNIPSQYKDGKLYNIKPEDQSSSFEFQRGSTSTRVNSNGLIEVVNDLDAPRIDYSTGEAALLLEPQRSNYFRISEEYLNSYWSLSSVDISSSSFLSPKGTSFCQKLTPIGASLGQKRIGLVNQGAIGAGTYTFSIFAKQGELRYLALCLYDTTFRSATFDLSLGIIARTSNILNSNIESFPNDWYRISITATTTTSLNFGTSGIWPYSSNRLAGESSTANDIDGLYIWGAQLETGSYPTSYIPTYGTAVTRNADICVGGGDASVFNDAEGVLYIDASTLANDGTVRRVTLSNGTTTNQVLIGYQPSSNEIAAWYLASGYTGFTTILHTLSSALDFNKIAFRYKANDNALFVNGIKVGSELTSSIMPTGIDRLNLDDGSGNYNFYGNTKSLHYFPEALSDGYMQILTSNANITAADSEKFIITVKTDNAGTSLSNQFTLPWIGDDYSIETSAGHAISGLSGPYTLSFPEAGTYDVAVTAASGTIRFTNGGDKAKLLDIKNWGAVEWNSLYESFYGCSNLSVNATDIPYITNVTLCSRAFRGCTSLTSLNANGWDVSSITSFASMLQGCTSLNSINVDSWNTSAGVNFGNFIFSCSSLKADFSEFEINSATTFTDFAAGTNINETGTTTNYDNTLISWAAQTPQNNIVINFGTAKYSNAAAAARELLTRAVVDGGYGWTITDGGGVDLLDTYTGAAAAYSLRTIKSSTTKVVRVRADVVGQPEQDFTAAQITDGTLATFVGAGNNGYVVTWYDQSGNGNHATQGTASQQPQIVASGVVITENGMPAVQFDGVDDKLLKTSFTIAGTNALSAFSVNKGVATTGNGSFSIDGIIGGADSFIMTTETGLRTKGGFALYGTQSTINSSLVSMFKPSPSDIIDVTCFINGTSSAITISSNNTMDFGATTTLYLGSSFGFNGIVKEVILYPSDVTSNRTGIETNINDYYNIY